MKKTVSVILALALTLALLAGSAGCKKEKEYTDSIKIVCTVFPVYDWVKSITADLDPARAHDLFGAEYEGRTTNVEIILLRDNGADLHSYQPSAKDMIDIATCDLLIYVGGESDKWIADGLKNSTNPNQKVICLMEEMKADLIKEDHEGHAHGEIYDEHVWLSLKNAALFCEKIAAAIKEADSENQILYSINEEEYIARLNGLDRYIEDLVATATKKALIFADRFPFAYLMQDYGIEYYAAFDGCSSETNASFDTIISLAAKVDELEIEILLTTENTDGKVADTVRQATKEKNQRVRPLNSMQFLSPREIEAGITYITLMEENITFLKEALN